MEEYDITGERNQRGQINISCNIGDGKQIGMLLATYYMEGNPMAEACEKSVHVEQIYVEKKYRKKGIGRKMFLFLLEELNRIESSEHITFRFLYGEVGKTGNDNPKTSIPFYKSLDGISYGLGRSLSYRLCNRAAMDGLDKFYFYIVKCPAAKGMY